MCVKIMRYMNMYFMHLLSSIVHLHKITSILSPAYLSFIGAHNIGINNTCFLTHRLQRNIYIPSTQSKQTRHLSIIFFKLRTIMDLQRNNIGRIGYHFKAWIVSYQTVIYVILIFEWGVYRWRKFGERSKKKCCKMSDILALGIWCPYTLYENLNSNLNFQKTSEHCNHRRCYFLFLFCE